jgi:hypothetical protein
MFIELLSEKDKMLIDKMRRIGVDNEEILNSSYADCDYFLRYWDSSKYRFKEIFKNELILKKKVNISIEDQTLHDDMWMLTRSEDFQSVIYNIESYLQSYNNLTKQLYSEESLRWIRPWSEMMRYLFETESLICNKYNGDSLELKISSDKIFKLTHGCKVMKAISKLSQIAGVKDTFERVRIKHSQIMNEANISANLCLSIHPLDYMTASYNDNNWRSCMSWEDGEYRRGVIEMMNSPYVIVAYLESNHQHLDFWMNGKIERWNSKKWREFIIVSSDGIFGIKGYPYWNKQIEDLALIWIKDLFNQVEDNKYSDNISSWLVGEDICDSSVQSKLSVKMSCGPAMYNDFYSGNIYHAILAKNIVDSIVIDYSGESECVICGREAAFEEDDSLGCEDCVEIIYCWSCGDRIFNDNVTYVNGRPYCSSCYNNLPVCDCCEDVIEDDTDYLRFCLGVRESNEIVVKHQFGVEEKFCCEDCAEDVFLEGKHELLRGHERYCPPSLKDYFFNSIPIVPMDRIKNYHKLNISDDQVVDLYSRLAYFQMHAKDEEKYPA